MTNDPLQTLAPHLMVGLAGSALTDEERAILSRYPIPGVILFERNVAGSRPLVELTQEIRRLFRESRDAVPLIAADHEGGIVSYLARAIGAPPTQMAVGRTGDEELCGRLFAENARRLRSCGVNVMLGPVADINSEPLNPVIGTRSFGGDEPLVSRLAAAAVRAARREGVVACLKHFPGHGPTAVDSHLAFAALSSSLEELRARDARPFSRGIEAGAECVMMGHVAPRGRKLPASLDPEIAGGMLRGELGFGGAVVTDGLEMEGARAAARSTRDLCRRSLEAGCDILLFSSGAEEVFEALRSSDGEARDGGPSDGGGEGASAESLARVRRLSEVAAAREREFELPNDARVYDEIARRSIRTFGGAVPASPAIRGWRAVFHAERGELGRFLVRRFIDRSLRSLGAKPAGGVAGGAGAPDEAYGLEPSRAGALGPAGLESIEYVFGDAADAFSDIVFLLNRRPLDAAAVRRLAGGARFVVVAGWPYAAELLLPDVRGIVTYGLYDAAADLVGGFARGK